MRAVHRFPTTGNLTFEMPQGAQILHADGFDLWALVDTEKPPEKREFVIAGTGHKLPARPLAHVSTWREGIYVWHLFEMFKNDVPDDLDPDRHDDFRYLVDAGFALGDPVGDPEQPSTPKLRPWIAPPENEPVDPHVYACVARLQEHGYGPIVAAR